MRVFLVPGTHLFSTRYTNTYKDSHRFFMAEDRGLCTHFKYHKHKLIFFLSAMRHHAKDLRAKGYPLHYEKLSTDQASFFERLEKFLKASKTTQLTSFEIEDKFFRHGLAELCRKNNLKWEVLPSPLFLTGREEFARYLEKNRPFMKTFYEGQRKARGILVTGGKPVGGKWSFDSENRKKLPKGFSPAPLPDFRPDTIVEEVKELVDGEFGDHPGESESFWLGVQRSQARYALDRFLEDRLEGFGPYQDAISSSHPFVCHSVLSPYINSGLLTPEEVLDKVLAVTHPPLASLEGFVRQVLGWREFVRGIYEHYSEREDEENFWGHHAKLTSHWWEGTTGIPPLDDAIKKATRYGYTHHIERLMVVGNLMLLCEVDPREVHRWFMEMHVDSADWVMGPNVYGMSQFSDGGIFATKPYICGSNYYRKMSDYPKGEWCDEVDGLYWRFIGKHREFYAGNPRMGMMANLYEKMAPKKKEAHNRAAKRAKERLTAKGKE